MDTLSIRLFGGIDIRVDDGPALFFDARRAEMLAAYLAVTKRPHGRDALALLLWDDRPPAQAMANLRSLLARLPPPLKPYLTINRQQVAFSESAPIWLDVAEFESELVAMRAERPSPATAAQIEAALALYRGDFLAGVYARESRGLEEWTTATQERLRQAAIAAHYWLADYCFHRRDYPAGINYAGSALQMDPLRESGYRLLMRLLARNWQRNAALTQYEKCRRMLDEELGIEPSAATTAVYQRIHLSRSESRPSLPPQFTSFVGRQRELARLSRLLDDNRCRLITILGQGGSGKSRLALEAGNEWRGDYSDGVFFAPLGEAADSGLVRDVAAALHVPLSGKTSPQTQLLNYLRGKELLLILDNVERQLEASTALARAVLDNAPAVKLLVTSQERLQLPEERLLPLEGLATPAANEVGTNGRHEALQLFETRARHVQSHFALDEDTAVPVARICRLVEGLPLAIELAAATLSWCSPERLADEIQNNLDFLAAEMRDIPQRQRSARAAFNYSWRFLTAAEKEVFRRLSLFGGGFDAAAAAEVAGATAGQLTVLVNKSMVRQIGPDRFQLHSLLRQYGAAELTAADEAAYGRHAHYYLHLLRRVAGQLRGAAQLEALATLRADVENIRLAWRWALAGRVRVLVDAGLDGLAEFLEIEGAFQEALDLLSPAIAMLREGDEGPLLGRVLARYGNLAQRLSRYDEAKHALMAAQPLLAGSLAAAAALNALGRVAKSQGDFAAAIERHQAALALSRQNGDGWQQVGSLMGLTSVSYRQGRLETARHYCQESLAIARDLDDERRISDALSNLALLAYQVGEYRTARRYAEESLALKEKLNDRGRLPHVLNNLGITADILGDYEAAWRYYEQSLAIWQESGEQWGVALAHYNLGAVATHQGRYADAKQHNQQSLAICRQVDDRRGVADAINSLGDVDLACERLDEAERLYREALAIRQEIGAQGGVAASYCKLGEVAYARGRYEEAEQWLAQSLAAQTAAPDQWLYLSTLTMEGKTAAARNQPEKARARFQEVVQLADSYAAPAAALSALNGWAELYWREGEWSTAVGLWQQVARHPVAHQTSRDQAARWLATVASEVIQAAAEIDVTAVIREQFPDAALTFLT